MNKGAFSILEESMQPGLHTLEDLDPDAVAEEATQAAMAPLEMADLQGPSERGGLEGMKKQLATLIQEEALKKDQASKEFQQRSYAINRGQGK